MFTAQCQGKRNRRNWRIFPFTAFSAGLCIWQPIRLCSQLTVCRSILAANSPERSTYIYINLNQF